MHGKQRAASHAEPDHDGSQKCHQCVSAANGSQGAGTEHTTDDNCICNIINLLQQVSEHHRERKQQKCF